MIALGAYREPATTHELILRCPTDLDKEYVGGCYSLWFRALEVRPERSRAGVWGGGVQIPSFRLRRPG